MCRLYIQATKHALLTVCGCCGCRAVSTALCWRAVEWLTSLPHVWVDATEKFRKPSSPLERYSVHEYVHCVVLFPPSLPPPSLPTSLPPSLPPPSLPPPLPPPLPPYLSICTYLPHPSLSRCWRRRCCKVRSCKDHSLLRKSMMYCSVMEN